MTNEEIIRMIRADKDQIADEAQERAYRRWFASPEKPSDDMLGIVNDTLKLFPTDELFKMWQRCKDQSHKIRLLKHQIGEILEARLRSEEHTSELQSH